MTFFTHKCHKSFWIPQSTVQIPQSNKHIPLYISNPSNFGNCIVAGYGMPQSQTLKRTNWYMRPNVDDVPTIPSAASVLLTFSISAYSTLVITVLILWCTNHPRTDNSNMQITDKWRQLSLQIFFAPVAFVFYDISSNFNSPSVWPLEQSKGEYLTFWWWTTVGQVLILSHNLIKFNLTLWFLIWI